MGRIPLCPRNIPSPFRIAVLVFRIRRGSEIDQVSVLEYGSGAGMRCSNHAREFCRRGDRALEKGVGKLTLPLPASTASPRWPDAGGMSVTFEQLGEGNEEIEVPLGFHPRIESPPVHERGADGEGPVRGQPQHLS